MLLILFLVSVLQIINAIPKDKSGIECKFATYNATIHSTENSHSDCSAFVHCQSDILIQKNGFDVLTFINKFSVRLGGTICLGFTENTPLIKIKLDQTRFILPATTFEGPESQTYSYYKIGNNYEEQVEFQISYVYAADNATVFDTGFISTGYGNPKQNKFENSVVVIGYVNSNVRISNPFPPMVCCKNSNCYKFRANSKKCSDDLIKVQSFKDFEVMTLSNNSNFFVAKNHIFGSFQVSVESEIVVDNVISSYGVISGFTCERNNDTINEEADFMNCNVTSALVPGLSTVDLYIDGSCRVLGHTRVNAKVGSTFQVSLKFAKFQNTKIEICTRYGFCQDFIIPGLKRQVYHNVPYRDIVPVYAKPPQDPFKSPGFVFKLVFIITGSVFFLIGVYKFIIYYRNR